MSAKKKQVQEFLSDYLTLDVDGDLILLKTNKMITIHFTNDEGKFNSVVISARNAAKILYDSVLLSGSLKGLSTGLFKKQSE